MAARCLLGVALGALLLGVSPASAAPVIYEFSGQIDFISGNETERVGPLALGDNFSGTLTYDADAGATQSGRITFNLPAHSYVYEDENDGISVDVFDRPEGQTDNFQINARQNDTLPTLAFIFELWDFTGTTFQSTNLPETLDLGAYDLAIFQFNLGEVDGSAFVSGPISELRVVPEPTSLAILLLGGLLLTRRRH